MKPVKNDPQAFGQRLHILNIASLSSASQAIKTTTQQRHNRKHNVNRERTQNKQCISADKVKQFEAMCKL